MPEGDFWAFSLRLYAKPGVAEACLGLQDSIAADVNLVLFAAWLGASGRPLDGAEAQMSVDAVVPWQQDIVAVLRGVRRRLKNGPTPAPNPQTEELRQSVKASELAAEKVEQDTLQRLLRTQLGAGSPGDPVTAAVANIFSLLRLTASGPLGKAEARLIGTIVKAAIPEASDAAVADAFFRET